MTLRQGLETLTQLVKPGPLGDDLGLPNYWNLWPLTQFADPA